MGVVSKKLRDSARGQDCTLKTQWCEPNNETVVLCHLPSEVKGMGNKSDDWHAAFGCASCHQAIDHHRFPREVELSFIIRGLQRTHKIWRDTGRIIIAGDNEKPRKPSSKIMPRRPLTVGA
jgi:hypothetical protein